MTRNISLETINRLVEERLSQSSRRGPSHDTEERILQRLRLKPGQLWFLRLAKADLAALSLCTDSSRNNLIGLGWLVMFTGTVAFLAAWYTFSTMIFPKDASWGWILGAGLAFIYACGIVLIDREIVASLRSSALMIIGRLIFATLVSLAVSYPVKLLFFSGEIQRAIQDTVETELEAEQKALDATKVAREDYLKGLHKQFSGEIEKLEEGRRTQLRIVDDERRRDLCGARCLRAQGEANAYTAKIGELRAKLESIERDHPADDVAQRESEFRAKVNAEVRARQDLMSKWRASDRVRDKVGAGSYYVITFFVIAFFWCLEMVPVLMKSVIGKSEYNYYLEARQNINSQKIVSITNLYMEIMQDPDHPENVLRVPPEITDWMHASMEDEKVPYSPEPDRRFFVAEEEGTPPAEHPHENSRASTRASGGNPQTPVQGTASPETDVAATPIHVAEDDATIDEPPRA